MLMTPPTAGDSFTGPSGVTYTSTAQEVEIGGADVRIALMRNWAQQPPSAAAVPGVQPTWFHVGNKLTFADFSATALSVSEPLFTLAPHAILQGIKIKHSVAFGGGAISAYTISVGDSGSAALYATAFNVFQAPGSRVYQLSNNFAGEDALVGTQITITATAVGANLSAATAGVVDVWALVSTDL